MNQKIRILIADDHVVVRHGLVLVLRQEADFEVVGEAKDGLEAVQMAQQLQPDLVILDWKMPHMDGLEAAEVIRQKMPSIYLLLLSGAPIESAALDALNEGINGFVLKDIPPDDLSNAIRVIIAGNNYLCPQVTQALIEYSQQAIKSNKKARQVGLTPREVQILRLMIQPLTYYEIGEQLSISEETVRRHAKNILAKLNQRNRTQAVIEGLRIGIISLEDRQS